MGEWIAITPEGQPGYLAVPPDGTGAGVLVLHAWWGLTEDFVNFCELLAAKGFVSLAPGLYPEGKTADTIAAAQSLVDEHDSDPSVAARFLQAGLQILLDRPELTSDQVGAIGFSMGAYWALELADSNPENVAAVVAIYGSSDSDFSNATADVLLHFAENDDYEPQHLQQALERTLRDAGRDVAVYTYPGTKHWFVEPSRPREYSAAAAALVWERTVEFLQTTLT